MAASSYNTSAPGSLMLLGEHAVLAGHPAVACAVDRRISVALSLREDRALRIRSGLGDYESSLDAIDPSEPHRFVLAVVCECIGRLKKGLEIEIGADMDARLGLGTSAAVTAACWAAMNKLCELDLDDHGVFDKCRNTIRSVQGSGSGTDAAASVYGGVVAYSPASQRIERCLDAFPITVRYSGAKTPTPEVIALVKRKAERHPKLFENLYRLMGACTFQAVEALRRREQERFGELMNMYHGLLEALGVGTEELSRIVHAMRRCPEILGAKISGAGLGDCAVGWGAHPEPDELPGTEVACAVSPEGLRYESA